MDKNIAWTIADGPVIETASWRQEQIHRAALRLSMPAGPTLAERLERAVARLRPALPFRAPAEASRLDPSCCPA